MSVVWIQFSLYIRDTRLFVSAVYLPDAFPEISTQNEMEDAIDQAQQQFEITLTPEQQQQLLELLQKLDSIDLNLEDLKQQAQNIYDKLSDMGLDMDSLKEEAGGFFSRIFQAIKDFFTNLFS